MARELLKHDPERGLKMFYHDLDGDNFGIEYEQDPAPILEVNKELQTYGRRHYAHDPDMWHVASIPIGVQYEWMIKHGVDLLNEEHWPKVKRLLNDPDYRYLKTAEIII